MHAADLRPRALPLDREPAAPRQREASFRRAPRLLRAEQMRAHSLLIGAAISLGLWALVLTPFFL